MSYDSKTFPQLCNNESQCFQWFSHFKNWNLIKFQIFETKVKIVNMDQIKSPIYIYIYIYIYIWNLNIKSEFTSTFKAKKIQG
jgi:hypothetical protein